MKKNAYERIACFSKIRHDVHNKWMLGLIRSNFEIFDIPVVGIIVIFIIMGRYLFITSEGKYLSFFPNLLCASMFSRRMNSIIVLTLEVKYKEVEVAVAGS